MGEEYGETRRSSTSSTTRIPRWSRRCAGVGETEFADFHGRAEPPDAAAPATFESARLVWSRRDEPPHAAMLDWHRRLLELRRTRPALRHLDPATVHTQVFERRAGTRRDARGAGRQRRIGLRLRIRGLRAHDRVGGRAAGRCCSTRTAPRARSSESTCRTARAQLVIPASSTLVLGAEPPT